jgi:hypothetical protein
MSVYKLVNPHIEGNMSTEFSANSAASAGKKAWASISEHLMNNVPKFAFTLQNGSDLYHFMVKEKLNQTGGKTSIDFDVSLLENKLTKNGEKLFKQTLKKTQQKIQSGGKKKRYDDDDDDDDDDDYSYLKLLNKLNSPINYWYYNPWLYTPYVNSVYMPTFVAPLSPYVEIEIKKTPVSALFMNV